MITLSTSTWLNHDAFEQAQKRHDVRVLLDPLKAAGFSYIDANLWMLSNEGGPITREDWRDWVCELREYADKIGVKFRQVHGATVNGKHWDDPDTTAVEHMNAMNFRCVEAAKLLGAEWMVMHPYNLPHDALYSREKAKAATLANVAPYVELAKKLGVGIALENMVDFGGRRRRYCGGAPEELIDLADSINDPAVGICIDTGHANNSGMHVGEFIRAVGSRLKCTHINDNLGDKDSHLPPYFGNVDWKDVMQALRDVQYDGDFSFELGPQNFPLAQRESWYRFVYNLGMELLAL